MFYPDQKPHISPSALDNWINSRSNFVRSYFEGEKSPETSAMKAGTKIHRLIEAGLIPAKHVFDIGEDEVNVVIKDGIKVMGKPDSMTQKPKDGIAYFVDYKSGKANDWKEKLPKDVKMRTTAWLVWNANQKPEKVIGYIEYIATTWDPVAKEVVPIEGIPTESIEQVYTAKELEDFTQVILKAIDDVNDFYETWKNSTSEFISDEDCREYVDLENQIAELTAKQDAIKEKIMGQMDFGYKVNYKTPFGTFYITERKTYEYPEAMRINYLDYGLTLADADEIAGAVKVAKKNYELIAEPKSTSRSLGYRKAKE